MDQPRTNRPDARIQLIDIRDRFKRKRMQGYFSDDLIAEISARLETGERVVLFHNRRGYAPVLECGACGNAVPCPHCDVSLTYHQEHRSLNCHYCGYQRGYPAACDQCGSRQLSAKGVGSEQVQEKLAELFPDINVGRMDRETTRGKHGYQTLWNDFRKGKFPILVGTQMLIKGADLRQVGLVGVLQADSLWNIPDYRAAERAYQLLDQLVQGSGGARVLIQAYRPDHLVLRRLLKADHEGLVTELLEERREFLYPPYVRLIRITLKARSALLAKDAGEWLATALRVRYPEIRLLGPEPPHVPRVRRWFLTQILLKIPVGAPLGSIKKGIKRTERSFYAISKFGSVRIVYDVDHI